eukprot:5018593-Prymnesium_polylepis.2
MSIPTIPVAQIPYTRSPRASRSRLLLSCGSSIAAWKSSTVSATVDDSARISLALRRTDCSRPSKCAFGAANGLTPGWMSAMARTPTPATFEGASLT